MRRLRVLQLLSLASVIGMLFLSSFTRASAQATPVFANPALVVDGGTVTLTTAAPSDGGTTTLQIIGPGNAGAFTTHTGTGTVTLTTPALPAGLYEVTVGYDVPPIPPTQNLFSFQVFEKNGLAPTALQGQYMMQLSGQAANVQSGLKAAAALASFTADGNGNITAGVLDLNTPAGVETGLPLTGNYQINAFGAGTINLVTSIGTLPVQLQSNPLFSTSLVQVVSGLSYAPAVSEYIESGTIASNAGGLVSTNGTLLQLQFPSNAFTGVSSPQISSTLNSSFPASVTGEQSGSDVALAGTVQFQLTTGGAVTSRGTLAGNGTSFSYAGLTGTYTQFDQTTGRATLTLTDPSQPSATAQQYAIYQLPSSTGFFFMTTNPRSSLGLLAGTAGTY